MIRVLGPVSRTVVCSLDNVVWPRILCSIIMLVPKSRLASRLFARVSSLVSFVFRVINRTCCKMYKLFGALALCSTAPGKNDSNAESGRKLPYLI